MAQGRAAWLFCLLLVGPYATTAQAQESREARFQRLLSGFKHIELKGRLYPPDGFDVDADSLQGEAVDSTLAEEFLCPALNYDCHYIPCGTQRVRFKPRYRLQLSKGIVGLLYSLTITWRAPEIRFYLSTFRLNEAQRIETVALDYYFPSRKALFCDLNADHSLVCKRMLRACKPNGPCEVWETESNYSLNSDGYFILKSERHRVHRGVSDSLIEDDLFHLIDSFHRDSRVENPEAPWTETVRFDERKEFERFLPLFPEVAPQNHQEALGRIKQDVSDTSGCLPPELASLFLYETLNIDRGVPRAFHKSRLRAVGRFSIGSEAVALIYEVIPLNRPIEQGKEYQLRLTTFSRKYPHALESLILKQDFCCRSSDISCSCEDFLLGELDAYLNIRTLSLMEAHPMLSPIIETPENQRQFYEFDCEYQIMPNGRIRGLKREVRFTVGTYQLPSGSPRMLQLSDWPAIQKYEGPIRWWNE